MTVTVGQLVRISPEVIPETAKDDDLLGDLGNPGLFRHAIFEIIELKSDPARGEIALCRMTNPEVFKTVIPGVKEVKYEGELVLLVKDIVPANMKTTLEYIVEVAKTKEQMIKDLFVERKKLEAKGLDKRNKEMRANWKEIQILRGEVAGPAPSSTVRVILPKHKAEFPQGIEMEASSIPVVTDEESVNKFKRLLTNKLRGIRSQRKAKMLETKTILGMVSVSKVGGVYLQENSLLKAYEEMMKTTLETDKKPTDAKANYVGVEIEFIYNGNYDALKKLLIEAKLHKNVCLKEDGSLRSCHGAGSNYRGKEMTILAKSTEIESVLKRLDKVLADPAIDGYANRSCGLHVHLDMRNRDAAKAYKNLVRVQNILRGAQPIGRISSNFCKTNTSETFSDVMEGGERYWVVNPTAYKKHKSIEIRIHEGTTDCEAIYNWVSFLEAIVNHNAEIPKNELKFAEDLAAKFDIEIPLNAIDYVDRRIEKFRSLAV